MAAAAAMGDLFAPGFNRSDPNSVAAAQGWQDRNFALTPEMLEQTRGASTSTPNPIDKYGITKGAPTITRGSLDPEALRIYAQGGRYDLNARRNAIAAAMQPAASAAPAAPAGGGGGGGLGAFRGGSMGSAFRGGGAGGAGGAGGGLAAMLAARGGGGGGLTGLGGLGALRGGGGLTGLGGLGAFRGGGDPHAGMHYDPSTPIGGDPWKAGPGKSGWEELAAAQAQLEADPYGQYFGNKAQISGSATETGWMNALQPWQGGVSVGGQPGSGINTSGFIGGGTMMHADPAYWGAGGPGAQKEAAAQWQWLQQNNPGQYGSMGGDAAAAAGIGSGIGPSGNSGVGPGASGGGGGMGGGPGGGGGGGGNIGGGWGSDTLGSNAVSGDQLGYAGTQGHFGDTFSGFAPSLGDPSVSTSIGLSAPPGFAGPGASNPGIGDETGTEGEGESW